jgi:hypothetical protein
MTTIHNIKELVKYCQNQPSGVPIICEFPHCLTQANAFEVFRQINHELEGIGVSVVVRTADKFMEVVKYGGEM